MTNSPAVNLSEYIRDVADFPKPGIMFKDITPLLANHAALEACIDQFVGGRGQTRPEGVGDRRPVGNWWYRVGLLRNDRRDRRGSCRMRVLDSLGVSRRREKACQVSSV